MAPASCRRIHLARCACRGHAKSKSGIHPAQPPRRGSAQRCDVESNFHPFEQLLDAVSRPYDDRPISTVTRPQPVPKNASAKPSAEHKQRLHRNRWKQFNISSKGSRLWGRAPHPCESSPTETCTIFGKVRIGHDPTGTRNRLLISSIRRLASTISSDFRTQESTTKSATTLRAKPPSDQHAALAFGPGTAYDCNLPLDHR